LRFFPILACVLDCACRDKPSWRGHSCVTGDNQWSRGVVIVWNRSLGALDHQRRDLHSIKLSHLTEDRAASTISVPPDCSAQRSTATDTCKSATVRGQFAQSQSSHQKAHQTVNSTRHRTVRATWRQGSNGLNRQNPNGWVTWLAHRTLSGGAPDYSVRPSTAACPNG
jgi:hypothetical protein